MTKPVITRVWVAGVIALVAGFVIGGIGIALLFILGGSYTPAPSGSGYDFVPRIDGFFWAMVSLMIVGLVAAVAGGIAQVVAWIGTLVNTYQMLDRTWFAVVLAGGLVGLALPLVGFATMIAYLVAGPDDLAIRPLHEPPLHEPPPAPPLAEDARTLVPTQ